MLQGHCPRSVDTSVLRQCSLQRRKPEAVNGTIVEGAQPGKVQARHHSCIGANRNGECSDHDVGGSCTAAIHVGSSRQQDQPALRPRLSASFLYERKSLPNSCLHRTGSWPERIPRVSIDRWLRMPGSWVLIGLADMQSAIPRISPA